MFEEQSDKLIIRIIFSLLILLLLFLYKYVHSFLYPSSKQQLFNKFYPSYNSASTLHYLSRLMGFCIIFTYVNINLSGGMLLALADTLFQGVLIFILYLITLYIGESISLYNFTHNDEIIKRKNLSYSIVSFAQSISIAIILKEVLEISNHSLVLLFFLWLYSVVIYGLSIKLFKYLSPLDFNRLVNNKNLTIALSYGGFIIGSSFLITATLAQNLVDIPQYLQLLVLKILLIGIIFPLFRFGIKRVFLLQDHSSPNKGNLDIENPDIGYGVFEGTLFLTSALLTSVIVRQILFGVFYPLLEG